MDFTIGLVLGFLAGYVVREIISRRRHLQARQRIKMGMDLHDRWR